MAREQERRRNQRVHLVVRVAWATDQLRGRATLADLSASGARLEDSSSQPTPGAEIRVRFEQSPLPRIVVEGIVQRLTWDGFVVDFYDRKPELEAFLADALALVG